MTRLAIATAAAVLAAFLMPAAEAQQQRMPCAPRSSVVAGLSGPDHKERVVLRGIANDNMIEVWLSDEGGFSIILTRPEGGLSCMVSAGTAMHEVADPPKPPAKGS